jgi:general secretion pathway protein D
MLAAAVSLAGCAAQRAYQEGEELAIHGQLAESLPKFEEANRIDPGVTRYRLALIQSRERYFRQLIDQAEAFRRQGRLDAAEQTYRRVLAIQDTNERALVGLAVLEQQRRLDQRMEDALAAMEKKDMEVARVKLKAILQEDPYREGARAALRQLDEATVRPSTSLALAAAYRKPITIEFKDVPLKTLFEVLSRTAGMNFLFDKDVNVDQKTSIYLKNSTVENAVNLTLLTNQLDQRVIDANSVLIYPNTQAKQKDYQPMVVKSFYLANAEAKTVGATLKAMLKTRDVVVDDKLNLVIMRDSPDAIRLAEKLVAVHDVPESEVMLEVEILEVKRTRLLDLGINWPGQIALTPLPSASGGTLTLADLRNLNSSTIGATLAPVVINARKEDGDANILANPRIRTRNREKAKVLIGQRVPNITSTSTSTGFVAESITYVDVGLKLEVEPTIFLDGEVAIKVALEVSNIIDKVQTKSGSLAYEIGTRTAQTVLRLRDGENQVLAGLINDEDRRNGVKVPGLGDVPVLGRLFGEQTDDGSKTEIVLSITPRIVRNVRQPDATFMEFEAGTENSLSGRLVAGGGPIGGGPDAAEGQGRREEGTPSAKDPRVNGGPGSPPPAPGRSADASNKASGTLSASPPKMAVLQLQGPAAVKAGESFSVQVMMQSDQPLVSVPLAISYDPQLLQVASVMEGDFLRSGGQTNFANRIDPSGQILLTGTRTDAKGATGSGALATIGFQATGSGGTDTRVQVLNVSPVALGGQATPVASPAPLTVRIDPRAAAAAATGSR